MEQHLAILLVEDIASRTDGLDKFTCPLDYFFKCHGFEGKTLNFTSLAFL